MSVDTIIKDRKAQTAIEYLLLLMTVAVIVLLGFKTYLPRVQETANIYYNRAAPGILGAPPRCGDTFCAGPPFEDCAKCPFDCGPC
ncbi:MAG: hypothetical protein KAR32_11285 [Candidatus Omnitrophica bacterium]|nr:hypothetical protein [Candidatus Omnitrophota bacterium]